MLEKKDNRFIVEDLFSALFSAPEEIAGIYKIFPYIDKALVPELPYWSKTKDRKG